MHRSQDFERERRECGCLVKNRLQWRIAGQFVGICVPVEKEFVEVFLGFPRTGFNRVFDKHIIAKLSTFTRGEHHGGANSAVAMTEFNRTSRLSGACNSAAQTGNIKVPTCTPQVAVEELVESFKRFLSRTEFDSGLCGANH